MLKGKSKKSSTTKTKKGKELSEKTMGKIVGGINGLDDFCEDDEDYIVDDDFEVADGLAYGEVIVRENESLESALKRFKRKTARDGVLQEVRKREHYEKPSVKRKKKAEAARKKRKSY